MNIEKMLNIREIKRRQAIDTNTERMEVTHLLRNIMSVVIQTVVGADRQKTDDDGTDDWTDGQRTDDDSLVRGIDRFVGWIAYPEYGLIPN